MNRNNFDPFFENVKTREIVEFKSIFSYHNFSVGICYIECISAEYFIIFFCRYLHKMLFIFQF